MHRGSTRCLRFCCRSKAELNRRKLAVVGPSSLLQTYLNKFEDAVLFLILANSLMNLKIECQLDEFLESKL
jgi:hypothetical protein